MGTRNRTTLAAATASLLFGLTQSGSAAETTLTPNLNGFTSVEASHAFEVELRQGSAYRVEVRAEDDLARDLDIHTTGNRLILTARDGRRWRNERVRAVITMPTLQSFHGSGAAQARIEGFRSTAPFEIHLSGASSVVGDIESGDMRLDLSGASHVELRGRGSALHAEASGASRAELGAFSATQANVDLSGASRVNVNTTGRLDVQASGASRVTYVGRPLMGTIDTSGSSSIRSTN